AEQAETGTARIRFAHALVDFFERVLHVREAVMTVDSDLFQELVGERPKLIEQAFEPVLADRVGLIQRRRDGSKSDLPETDLLREMLIDAPDVQRLRR